jgi:hypothetical protein
MIADDEAAAAGTMAARPPGADEVRTACDRPGRRAASTAPRGMARARPRAAAGRRAGPRLYHLFRSRQSGVANVAEVWGASEPALYASGV